MEVNRGIAKLERHMILAHICVGSSPTTLDFDFAPDKTPVRCCGDKA